MRELDFDFLRERLSPEAMQIISASIEESRRRNHNFLSEDHVLLALCKKDRKLLQDTVCRNSLKIEDLTAETKILLDSTRPYVGRSFRMTPELKRTLRTAWGNVAETEHRRIETFDLLDAIERNGTSAAWEIIKKTGLPSPEFHDHLKEYKRNYLENRKRIKEHVSQKSSFASLPSNVKREFVEAVKADDYESAYTILSSYMHRSKMDLPLVSRQTTDYGHIKRDSFLLYGSVLILFALIALSVSTLFSC